MTPRLNLQCKRKLRVTELQPLHILSSICSKVVLLYDQINRRCWNFDTIGNYTVKFECIVYPKIQAFLWQLMHEKLCAREFLASKHIISHQQMTCPFCDYKLNRILQSFVPTLFGAMETME